MQHAMSHGRRFGHQTTRCSVCRHVQRLAQRLAATSVICCFSSKLLSATESVVMQQHSEKAKRRSRSKAARPSCMLVFNQHQQALLTMNLMDTSYSLKCLFHRKTLPDIKRGVQLVEFPSWATSK